MTDYNQSVTRIIERPGGTLLVVRRYRLEVVEGQDLGLAVEIEGGTLEVGKGAQCELVLSDPTVSEEHFRVEMVPRSGFLLTDLGSTNGTSVDGYRVGSIFLPGAAQITAGKTQMRFTILDDEVEISISERTHFGELIGHSLAMRRVFSILEHVASSRSTVLIEGESGTGKELAARALHDASPASDGPFITVDCGALPEQLIESELFGHARGAFTGAVSNRAGLLERAAGGTLLLDEIGELPLSLQPKLLRALESRTIRRLGETSTRALDLRVLAATNRRLSREATAGRFRKDLFFRLSVIQVRLPPLRERMEEVPRLVAHFLSRGEQGSTRGIPPSTMEMLCNHTWPGNVRELRNVVERMQLMPGMQPEFYLANSVTGESLAGEDAQLSLDLPYHEGKRAWTEHFEERYLTRLLQRADGNIAEAARMAGLSRQTCHRLVNKYGLAR